MDKASKSISLVLLGSSVFFSGCAEEPPVEETAKVEEPREDEWSGGVGQDEQAAASHGGTPHTVTHVGGRSHFVPIPIPFRSGPTFGGGAMHPGFAPTPAPGVRSSAGGRTAAPSGTTSHASSGVSARGGFGGSAHAAAS